MGGKGGGGDDGLAQQRAYMSTIQEDPSRPSGYMMNPDRTYVTKVEYAKRQADAAAKEAADKAAAAANKPAEAAPVSEPVVTQDTPTPTTPASPDTLTPPDSLDTGDALGGSIINPPQYWTGGLNEYQVANPSGQKKGAITTTQT